jgi:DNA-binding NarL/FixJ family response regulator
MHDELLYAERVLRSGGQGYLGKQESPEKLLFAIRQVLNGQIYISNELATSLVTGLHGRNPRPGADALQRLTDREFEILRLLGEGHSSREIAAQLQISSKTVDAHRAHIKDKLNLRTGLKLTHYAVQWVAMRDAQPGAGEELADASQRAALRPMPA